MSSAEVGTAGVAGVANVQTTKETRERIGVPGQETLDSKYPPGTRDVFLTCSPITTHERRARFQIGRCFADSTFETIDLMVEARNLGIPEPEIGCLVERVIEGMLAQWGNEPHTEPPAGNMWECALSAANMFVWRNSNLRRRILLAMVVCQGGREKSPIGLIRAITPNRLSSTSSLQTVIDELRAYNCSPREIALAWEQMLGLRFARGFETENILEWWHGLKFENSEKFEIAEEVNRLCVMRDLGTLIKKDPRNTTRSDSMGLVTVGADFLDMAARICFFCRHEWRHSLLVREEVERMFVTCLSRGEIARAFQMFVRFGSYFGLYCRDASGSIDQDSVTAPFNQLIHRAKEEAFQNRRYGVACALTKLVGCVRDVFRVKHLSVLANRDGQKIALDPWFCVVPGNTAVTNLL